MFAKLLILLVAVALVVGMAARTTHGAGPERVYVVKPTDTLWAIAVHNYAGDPREGVWKLEQRNGLHSETLRPGQKLVLPS
jgi:LysM repeat protein